MGVTVSSSHVSATPSSSHSSPAPSWGLSHRRQFSINSSKVSPSHRLHAVLHKLLEHRSLSRGAVLQEQTAPERVPHRVTSPASKPAPLWDSHRSQPPLGIHLLQCGEPFLPLLLHWPWCLQSCHTVSLLSLAGTVHSAPPPPPPFWLAQPWPAAGLSQSRLALAPLDMREASGMSSQKPPLCPPTITKTLPCKPTAIIHWMQSISHFLTIQLQKGLFISLYYTALAMKLSKTKNTKKK